METRTARHLMLLGLVLVIGLSAYLRLSGITWGINGVARIQLESSEGEPGYGHYVSFHPDEYISIRGMSPISLLVGELKAPDAYFEGTFNYNLWAVSKMLYDLHNRGGTIPGQKMTAGQFKFILLSGRLMSVVFDLATLVLLFAIISELTNQRLPALVGALVYGVLPMQVIYSHFMRTYTLANLLCVLVIWLSLKALKHRHWLLFVITGVAAGMAAATRYPAGLVLSVPCVLVLFQADATQGSWHQRFAKSFLYFLSGPLWLLAAGFTLGLFVGEPMLLLDFRTVVDAILFEATHYAPSGARNPFDLAPIWKYITVLIPYATYPVIWLLIYISTLYVILRPSLWPTVVPLCVFAMLYTYSMAKGYLGEFARLTMLLMPVFCIFVGMAWGEIFPKIVKRPLLFCLVMIVLLLLTTPSVLFDWAYGRAMESADVRDLLREDMAELIKDRSATAIAVSERDAPIFDTRAITRSGYFYTAMPAISPLKSDNVAVELERALTTPADFLVMGFERPLTKRSRDSAIHEAERAGQFRFLKMYSQAPTVLGKTFDLSNFPPDMTYPFPAILLFRKGTAP